MKKEDLIKKLQEIPGNPSCVIFDHKKNRDTDSGDGSSEGVYSFEVELIDEKADLMPDELQYLEEMGRKPYAPFIALTFDNPDFED